YTENAADYWENDLPYLKSVESPWDESSPKFLDQQVVTLEEVEQALGISLPRDESISADITRTDSDRVKQLQLAGETFSGRDVRESLDQIGRASCRERGRGLRRAAGSHRQVDGHAG